MRLRRTWCTRKDVRYSGYIPRYIGNGTKGEKAWEEMGVGVFDARDDI